MANKQKAYFGITGCARLILWFFLGWILGPIIRVQRGNILGAIVSFFLAFIFIWVDLVTILTADDITVLT